MSYFKIIPHDDKTLLVGIPIEIKDQFRAEFKNAVWNPLEKKWLVSKRSKKKLEQWLEIYGDIFGLYTNSIKEERDIQYTKKQIEELREQADSLKEQFLLDLKKVREKRKELIETKCLLSQRVNRIEEAYQKLKKHKQKNEANENEIKNIMNKVLNIDTIYQAYTKMCKLHGHFRAEEKKEFQEAQGVIQIGRKALRSIGLYSPFLEKLYFMNFNRPDRDNPRLLNFNKLYVLKELVEEEENKDASSLYDD